MATCYYCGDEIDFRYVDGRLTPIHVNGGWCSASSSGPSTNITKPFGTIASYVNPNAYCPVCGERVFYYRSPYGGRVFFDDLGWPWPKHPCTDNPQSQTGPTLGPLESIYSPFRNVDDELLDLYELSAVTENGESISLRFNKLNTNQKFEAVVAVQILQEIDVTISDLRIAPSFVVRTYETKRVIEFISARKQMIDKIEVARKRPSSHPLPSPPLAS